MQVRTFSWPVYQQEKRKLSSTPQNINFASQSNPAQSVDRFESAHNTGISTIPKMHFCGTNRLHNAVINEDTYQINQILRNKPPEYVNEIDEYGFTPFLLAAREGKLQALRIFLESGRGKVDVKATAPRWDTGEQIDVWELAELYGQTTVSAMLEEKMGIIKLPRMRRSSTCSSERPY
jgi:hypothetical protein